MSQREWIAIAIIGGFTCFLVMVWLLCRRPDTHEPGELLDPADRMHAAMRARVAAHNARVAGILSPADHERVIELAQRAADDAAHDYYEDWWRRLIDPGTAHYIDSGEGPELSYELTPGYDAEAEWFHNINPALRKPLERAS